MDMITLAMAKKYADSQRLGYTENTYYNIGWDGEISGKDVIPGEIFGTDGNFCRVSEVVCRGKSVQAATLEVKAYNGAFQFVHLSDFRTDVTNDGIWMFFATNKGNEALYALSFGAEVASLLGVSPGTYFYHYENAEKTAFFLIEISGKIIETIHTIDPKFIPGAVLPVVELSAFPNGIGDDHMVTTTAEESAMLDSALASDSKYVLVAFEASDVIACGILKKWYHADMGEYIGFTGSFIVAGLTQGVQLVLAKADGVWSVGLMGA